MNARERFKRIIREANDMGELRCSDNDAAALGILDDLIMRFVHLNTIQCEDWADQNASLIEYANELGYGQKKYEPSV